MNKVIWLTGLSGSGKTTTANGLETFFIKNKLQYILLDGDVLRNGLNKDLGFSIDDRTENIRRAAEVAKLFWQQNFWVVASFISPLAAHRELARSIFPAGAFIEVFVDAPIEVCESRGKTWLYSRARSGDVKDFTGITQRYERPENPEIVLKTAEMDRNTCVAAIVKKLFG